MRRWLATVSGIFGLVLSTASCNQVGGIKDGVARGDDPVVPCSTVDDCTKVEPATCRVPIGCEQKLCTYGDAIEGALAKAQVPGDCTDVVCDGAGKSKLVAQGTDLPDDNNICTLDACDGATPTHTIQAELPCYTGPAGTQGKGVCVEGIQHCDAQGNAVGGCDGEVVPTAETCISPMDEDCDGKANEEGQGCVCVPGDSSTCYTGVGGTDGVGICHGGMQICNADGLTYGSCVGEQTPMAETCDAAMADEDCNGQVNESGADCMCGDGYLSAGEECDDGNLDSTDGCTELCKVAKCSDGFTQTGVEECDDGNAVNTDACLNTCMNAKCGDNFVHAGVEQCDDANMSNTDACLNTCMNAKCGDNFVHAGVEECDDANMSNTDDCLNTCMSAKCGDGFVQAGVEQCDDANMSNTDACLNTCMNAKCGDGFVQVGLGETCDDGGTISGDLCSATCKDERKVLQVAAGGQGHTCALLNDGSVKCWGDNPNGELGLGDTITRGDDPNEMGADLPTVNLGAGKTATAIAASFGYYTCALLNGGSVKCWGSNAFGQLGLGDTNSRGDGPNEMGDNLPTVNLGTGKTATAITVGFLHTCALLNDGSVKCWGYNLLGQLGLGDNLSRGDGPNEMGDNLPTVNLGTGKTATAISAGYTHTCALLNDSSVKCWGVNTYGELGLGDTITRGTGPNQMGDNLPAINLGTGKTAIAISASAHTCAILNDGSVKCWGGNTYGELGQGDIITRGDGSNEMGDNLPTVNLGTGKTAFVMAQGFHHVCATLNDSSIKCWGQSAYGELGLGDISRHGDGPNEMGDNLPAVSLGTGKTASSVAASDYHTCALLNDGSVKCWGNNGFGQLGLGDTLQIGDGANEMGDNLPTVKLFSPYW